MNDAITANDNTLWAVSIHGPDDLVAAENYSTAICIANRFNAFWQSRVKIDHHPYDPRMWAVPIEWPHDRLSHADDLANPSTEYAWLNQPIGEANAAHDVLAERMRQINEEGFTPAFDDKELDHGDLAGGAAGYALNAADQLNPYSQGDGDNTRPDFWPFDEKWWKPSSPRRDLVKAAAMIIAEIERLDRNPLDFCSV